MFVFRLLQTGRKVLGRVGKFTRHVFMINFNAGFTVLEGYAASGGEGDPVVKFVKFYGTWQRRRVPKVRFDLLLPARGFVC